ncbi:MAG: hypothetical protein GPW19_04085 [Euryarchaeota archaeon]|nr:hypothetical protein [Euryarchaeota archaeon]
MAKRIKNKNFPIDEFINIDGGILIQDKDYPAVYEEEGNSPMHAVAKLCYFLGIDNFYNFGLYGMEAENEDKELAFEKTLQLFKKVGGAFRINYLKGCIKYKMEGKVFRKNGKWVLQAVIIPEFEEIDE